MIEKLKKWNWTAFVVIIFTCLLGFLSNKTVPRTIDAVYMTLIVGLPLSTLFAFITRED